ncbi:MAG: hypothetical protein JOZ79_08240 [Sphingomonas sp.]|nr:hypothetical protein [Sphingomonas sp.]
MFFDSAAMPIADGKPSSPGSIDEALRERFATMAKTSGTTVAEMLATMSQQDIEKAASEVAVAFVSAQAGNGVAATFAKDAAVSLSDAERSMIIAKARNDHDLCHGYLRSPPAFTAADAAKAVCAAIKQKAGARAFLDEQAVISTTLKARQDEAYAASKQALRDAHRQR